MFEKNAMFGSNGFMLSKLINRSSAVYCNRWRDKMPDTLEEVSAKLQESYDEIDRLERENEKLQQMLPIVTWDVRVKRAVTYVANGRTPEEAEEDLRKILPHIFDEEAEVISVTKPG